MKLHVKQRNRGMGRVEGTVSRREISTLLSVFYVRANILWLPQLNWCRLRWTGQIDWSSLVVVSMAPMAAGKKARGVQMCGTTAMCKHMDIMCMHVFIYVCVRVCVCSRWKWGFMLFKLAHTSCYQPIIPEVCYLNHTSPATFLCSLFE